MSETRRYRRILLGRDSYTPPPSQFGGGGFKAAAGVLETEDKPGPGFSGLLQDEPVPDQPSPMPVGTVRFGWDGHLEQRTRNILMLGCVVLAVLLSTGLLVSTWFMITGTSS
jgi:hypothetical protein